MRKLMFATNITIDGCCDHTQGIANEEVHEYFASLIEHAGLLVYGRKTYELMVPYWPDIARKSPDQHDAAARFAHTFDSVKKLVFSQTLDQVEDRNSELAKGSLLAEVSKLKKQPGKDILLGGVDLPGQLIEAGLVDEYYFVIHPVVAGEGRRLEGIHLKEAINLKLISTHTFKSGHVALHYARESA